jgi:hypothetical protein
MFARTMPLLTELGNSFALVLQRCRPQRGWAAERRKLFLVSVAVGEGEFRHGGTAAVQPESGDLQHAGGGSNSPYNLRLPLCADPEKI